MVIMVSDLYTKPLKIARRPRSRPSAPAAPVDRQNGRAPVQPLAGGQAVFIYAAFGELGESMIRESPYLQRLLLYCLFFLKGGVYE